MMVVKYSKLITVTAQAVKIASVLLAINTLQPHLLP